MHARALRRILETQADPFYRSRDERMPTPRYEREIRSLLDKMPSFLGESQTARGRGPGRQAPRRASFAIQDWWARDAYLMAALLTVLARFGERAMGAGGAHLLAWIAAALVIFAVVISVVRAVARPHPPKIWRGNVVTFPGRRPPFPLAALWRRLGRGGRGTRQF
jgi:hypothetical protein